MSKTRCPNCGCTVRVDRPREGAVVECRTRGVELEVVRKDPFGVDSTDDWQDDWEED
jgi:lysine biosynthesis protein LysW